MKKKKKRLPLPQLIGAVLLGLLIIGFFTALLLQNAPARVEDAEFIFAGTKNDADCSILISSGSCTVVDTGEAADGEHISTLLKNEGISKIDYLILTHPDKDHIGGAPELLDSFEVGELIVPHYGQYSAEYNSLLKKADTLGIDKTVLTEQRTISSGSLRITLYPPKESFYDDDNNYSIVTQIKHGNVNLLLAADIEKERIAELENVNFGEVELLKVPYHGRSSNASADFIRRVNPKIAIVNAGSPESKIQKVLSKLGAEVFCTVGNDCYFLSDGHTVTSR